MTHLYNAVTSTGAAVVLLMSSATRDISDGESKSGESGDSGDDGGSGNVQGGAAAARGAVASSTLPVVPDSQLNDATCVALNAGVSAAFSLEMNPSTVTERELTLASSAGSVRTERTVARVSVPSL